MTTYIKNSDGVQFRRSKFFRITDADLARQPNPNVFDIQMPAGSVLIEGDINVQTASNDAGTDVLDVGDAASANRYASDLNLKTTGLKALTPTGFLMVAGDDGAPKIRLTRVPQNAGTSTAFVAFVRLEYLTEGVADATQG